MDKKENGFVTPVALTKLTNASLKSLPSKVKKAGPVLSLYLEHRTRLRPVQSRSIANRAGLDLSPIRHETRKINMRWICFQRNLVAIRAPSALVSISKIYLYPENGIYICRMAFQ